MRNKTHFSMNIGLPSILLIFVVLCLVSFGVLSLVSANSDLKLSKKVLKRSSSYYETCNEAEEMLTDVHRQLVEAYLACDTIQSYQSKIQAIPTSYSYAISDLQDLKITLHFLYPENLDGDFYQIETWQIVTADDISYDESLHVIP
ncbi:MAG: hypothetical protein IJO85_10585 [Lachnospiraceae bacterium]|nr:hypothetical protein [Lachnospiraceae bacterium]